MSLFSVYTSVYFAKNSTDCCVSPGGGFFFALWQNRTIGHCVKGPYRPNCTENGGMYSIVSSLFLTIQYGKFAAMKGSVNLKNRRLTF